MQTKIFYLIGGAGSSVIDVGMRPSAIYHGSGIYGLKIVAHNIPANNATKVDQVEIIIRGREEQLLAFYNYVKSNDIRQFKKDARPKVTELNVYKGDEPDWTYCITSTMHEQIYKGFEMLAKSTEVTQSFQMSVEKNRREDRKREEKSRREDREREEKNRREDREREEKSRREDREREEKNRREDREREERNRKEDRERTNKILYEIKEIKEQGEMNRKEDREREEKNRKEDRERTNKILYEIKEIKEQGERSRKEDRERTNKILYEIKEIKEQGERNRKEDREREERNRKEDREREERYWERADKRFEKLFTNQTEILNILRP